MASSPAPWVCSVGTALPPHWVDQETLIAAFRELWAREHFNVERIEELHRSVQVGGRYLALPLEEYRPLERFSRAQRCISSACPSRWANRRYAGRSTEPAFSPGTSTISSS